MEGVARINGELNPTFAMLANLASGQSWLRRCEIMCEVTAAKAKHGAEPTEPRPRSALVRHRNQLRYRGEVGGKVLFLAYNRAFLPNLPS